MEFKDFLNNILSDLRVELTDEFDRNFERKAFFDEAWPAAKIPNSHGSLMMRSGDLRAGQTSDISGQEITFSNSMPYADIQNNGGQLTVTTAMKKYFWAMHFKAGKTSAAAVYYKRLALMKTGSKITIPARRFIGHHAQVDAIVKDVIDDNVKELAKALGDRLKQ